MATDRGIAVTAPAYEAAAPLSVGQLISHYRIEGQLGAGGMGVVYRATDVTLRRPVALKFLPPARAADSRARARFLREARAASALDHPYIGTVYEIGDDEATPFIAMALYEGETLQQRVERGPLPVEEVERIAAALSEALAAAHAAGIVHRDLKPANVMLPSDGGLKLLDFGVAKLDGDDAASLTREGALVGTLGYMAPEQLRAEAVDARADLWALGAILYEMLTGRPAFPGDSVAVVTTRILHEPLPVPPASAPKHLVALIEGLLVRSRDERIDSASRVTTMLARRESRPRRGRPRRRIWLTAAGLLVVLSGAGLGVKLWPQKRGWRREGATELYASGMAKFQQEKFDDAATDWEMGYRVKDAPQFLYNLGQAYRLGGHRDLALAKFRAYLDKVPDSPQRADVLLQISQLTPSPSPR